MTEREKHEKEIKQQVHAQAERFSLENACAALRHKCPQVHCLSNPVSMQDTANLLLAIGCSAIMAQTPEEAAEITSITAATLLNTGVPDGAKWEACRIAGQQANRLGHPLVLDPVGAGASSYRKNALFQLLHAVKLTLIRCNQEEACAILALLAEDHAAQLHGEKMKDKCGNEVIGIAETLKSFQTSSLDFQISSSDFQTSGADYKTGGVESSLQLPEAEICAVAKQLAKKLSCSVLISGKTDVITDGTRLCLCRGGDARIRHLTGSGCMLSALCAAFLGAGLSAFTAAEAAGRFWRSAARLAGERTSLLGGGIGTFHQQLFDAAEYQIGEDKEWSEKN